MNVSAMRHGVLRPLLRRPGTTAVIVLTLALGIGVNTGIYSMFHQVLMQKLDVPSPGELVVLRSPGPISGSVSTTGAGGSDQVFSFPMYRDLRDAGDRLTGIAAYRNFGANLASRGRTSSGSGALVSDNFFTVLELRPTAGRLFWSDAGADGSAPRVAILSHSFWQERYGGDRSAVGETLIVNGQPLEILGVAPPGFRSMNPFNPSDVFVPVALVDELVPGRLWALDQRRSYWLYLFGRLAPGETVTGATASLQPRYRSLIVDIEAPLQEGASDQFMQRFVERRLELVPAATGQSRTHDGARAPMLLLMSVTALVLLVACVNVTNLLLATAATERGEIAVRQALGAGRRDIVMRQMLQLLVLGGLGTAVSLPIALATTRLVVGMVPGTVQGLLDASLDWHVLATAIGVAAVAVLIAGLAPVVQVMRANPIGAIREQSGRTGANRAAARFRSGLIATQIAFALALLVISGLFIQSLVHIGRVDLGLERESVLTFSVSPGQNGYSPEQSRALFATIEERLAATPGVLSAAASMVPILSDSNWNGSVTVEGFEAGPDSDTDASFNAVGPAFFDVLSIPRISGRGFTSADGQGRPRVAIVNRAFAEKFDLGDDAVGRRMGSNSDSEIEIVGMVADAAYSSVKEPIPAQYFLPMAQTSTVGSASFYVRAAGDPSMLAPTVRSLVRDLDADLPVDNLETLDLVVRENVFVDRLIGRLASLFALLATALAAVGLFGVLSFTLARRTSEIGLRAALGASPAGVQRMVLGQTLKLALAGCAAGLLLGWLLGRLASGLLYEMSALSPSVMVGATVLLVLVALASGYAPARRAARIHPVEALRYE